MSTYTPSSEDARLYECCILYPYPLSQKEENGLLKEIEAMFSEAGGKLIEKDPWGRRGLAYPIKGAKEGSYIVYYYELDPTKITELEQQLTIHKLVLRHLFVKPPKGYQIVKFGPKYDQWMKERTTVEERRSREREDKLKEKVAEKAKRQAKRADDAKKTNKAPRAKVSDAALTEKLDELLSDDKMM